MDFFEHQEAARKKTHLLVILFLLAVAGIIGAIYTLVVGVLLFANEKPTIEYWQPVVFLYTALVVGGVISLASGYKTMELSEGGGVVARGLGGRQLDANATDYHERRLLNVVEEMAIAAGIPVPTVYVLDQEEGINAFAAGKSTSDAVIGVTRGCMRQLSRDELQGVIAHEFSHILNGDMRLNTRLMGLLFGILFVALIGRFILRGLLNADSRSSRRDNNGLSGILVAIVIAVGLMVIGYIGVFFANLIKASISRQREFLADASAVQFTRNPEGIGGALLKIGGFAAGSELVNPMAAEASHLFFGAALTQSLFSTHPPLEERIRRLLPYWNGEFSTVITQKKVKPEELASIGDATRQTIGFTERYPSNSGTKLNAGEALESMRTLHPEQVDMSSNLLAELPEHWIEACRSPVSAQCLIYALLLDETASIRESEMRSLRTTLGGEAAHYVDTLASELTGVHAMVKIALVDLAIASLRVLGKEEYERFHKLMWSLVSGDGQINLFEFMLLRVVTRHLDLWFRKTGPERVRHRRIDDLTDAVAVILSSLAAMSHSKDVEQVQRAFSDAAAHLRQLYLIEIQWKSPEECRIDQIGKALDKLATASPTLKKHILEACSHSVMADEGITSHEAELIRAVADSIGCAIPPFVRTAKRID